MLAWHKKVILFLLCTMYNVHVQMFIRRPSAALFRKSLYNSKVQLKPVANCKFATNSPNILKMWPFKHNIFLLMLAIIFPSTRREIVLNAFCLVTMEDDNNWSIFVVHIHCETISSTLSKLQHGLCFPLLLISKGCLHCTRTYENIYIFLM